MPSTTKENPFVKIHLPNPHLFNKFMLRNNQSRAQLARLIFLLLALNALGIVLLSALGLNQPDWDSAEAGLGSTFLRALYCLYSFLSLSYIVLVVASYITLIMWVRRAYYNLHQRPDIHPEYSDGWAAGAWFVPFLNFVRPFTIMREVWQDTQRAAWGRTVEPATLVGWWWTAFLTKMIIGRITSRIGSSDTTGFSQSDLLAALVDAGAQALAAVFTWYLIGRVAKFEEELAIRQEIERLGQPEPAAHFTNPDQSDYALEEGY